MTLTLDARTLSRFTVSRPLVRRPDMEMSLAMLAHELPNFAIDQGLGWDAMVVNLEAFGFGPGETTIRNALGKVYNQMKSNHPNTTIPNLGGLGLQQDPMNPGQQQVVAIPV